MTVAVFRYDGVCEPYSHSVARLDLGLPGASDRMQWFVVSVGCRCLKRVSEVIYVKP